MKLLILLRYAGIVWWPSGLNQTCRQQSNPSANVKLRKAAKLNYSKILYKEKTKLDSNVTLARVRFAGTDFTSIRKFGGRGKPKSKPPYLENKHSGN